MSRQRCFQTPGEAQQTTHLEDRRCKPSHGRRLTLASLDLSAVGLGPNKSMAENMSSSMSLMAPNLETSASYMCSTKACLRSGSMYFAVVCCSILEWSFVCLCFVQAARVSNSMWLPCAVPSCSRSPASEHRMVTRSTYTKLSGHGRRWHVRPCTTLAWLVKDHPKL